MARYILWGLALVWFAGGVAGDLAAKTVLQQIHAQLDYVIAAVFIAGAEIVGAISAAARPAATAPREPRVVHADDTAANAEPAQAHGVANRGPKSRSTKLFDITMAVLGALLLAALVVAIVRSSTH